MSNTAVAFVAEFTVRVDTVMPAPTLAVVVPSNPVRELSDDHHREILLALLTRIRVDLNNGWRASDGKSGGQLR